MILLSEYLNKSGTRPGWEVAQSFFDACANGQGVWDGVCEVDRTVFVRSNSTIEGTGFGSAILRSKPGVDIKLLMNSWLAGQPTDTRNDRDIAIRRMTFEGDPTLMADPQDGLVSFYGVEGLCLDIAISNHRKNGLFLVNCDRWHVERFTGINFGGWMEKAKVWGGGCGIFPWAYNTNGHIENVYMRTGGVGVRLPQRNTLGDGDEERTLFHDAIILDMMEAGFTGATSGSLIHDVISDGVRQVAVSGHNAEMSGQSWQMHDCTLVNADRKALFLMNTRNVECSRITMRDANRKGETDGGYVEIASLRDEQNMGSNGTEDTRLTDCTWINASGYGGHPVIYSNHAAPNRKLLRVSVSGMRINPAQWASTAPWCWPSLTDVFENGVLPS